MKEKEKLMTHEQKIDKALDSVLKAAGLDLRHYTAELTLNRMRKAMVKIMSESYISGSNDNFNAMQKSKGI